ncbi:MAG: diaminopimelate epimerase [Planctomycetes bacterium]|nr:diaminopimelate epimerase [Planctomycetota bacterium]
MRYAKMHGCGNSFYVVDARCGGLTDQGVLEAAMQHGGDRLDVDGLLLIHPSSSADVKMVIYNADGSRAAMCGNGVRCLVKRVVEDSPESLGSVLGPASLGSMSKQLASSCEGLPDNVRRTLLTSLLQREWAIEDQLQIVRLTIETDGGIREAHCISRNGSVESVTVAMGQAETRLEELNCTLDGEEAFDRKICIGDSSFEVTVLGFGNLHCVVFVESVDAVNVPEVGRLIESCVELFPDSVNVHFVELIASHHLKMQTWERGSGATLACGTGACAAVVAGVRSGRCSSRCRVDQPGGVVHVDVADQILMAGPAVEVEKGCWADSIAHSAAPKAVSNQS